MNRAFQNERVIAAGGTVHIVQSLADRKTHRLLCHRNRLVRFQTLQYLTAFYLQKRTQSICSSLIVISGAYGAFSRNVLVEIGGYRKSVGEDMDITLKVHRYIKAHSGRYLMAYVPASVCYTECPENLKNLTKQRIRWQKAFIDCVALYGRDMFRRFRLPLSLFFLFDSLLLGTVTAFTIILVPVLMIVRCEITFCFALFFGADFILGIIEGIVTLLIASKHGFCFDRKSIFQMVAFIPYQLLTYRFLSILYVYLGIFSYVFNKNHWNKAQRLGRTNAQPKRWEQNPMFRVKTTPNKAYKP